MAIFHERPTKLAKSFMRQNDVWVLTDWFCPSCGKRDMWQLAEAGSDYYHDCSADCGSCGCNLCCVEQISPTSEDDWWLREAASTPPTSELIAEIREYWTAPLPKVYCGSCSREVELPSISAQCAAGGLAIGGESAIPVWMCPHCGGTSWRSMFTVNGRDAREDIQTLLSELDKRGSTPPTSS